MDVALLHHDYFHKCPVQLHSVQVEGCVGNSHLASRSVEYRHQGSPTDVRPHAFSPALSLGVVAARSPNAPLSSPNFRGAR